MTKAFLKFPPQKRSYLPNPVGRRFGGSMHMRSMCFLSDAEKAEQEELLGKIKTQTEGLLATRATKEELAAISARIPENFGTLPLEALRSLADEKTGAMVMLTNQGIEIQRLKTEMAKAPKDMSIRSQIEAWFAENKPTLDNFKKRENKGDLTPLDIKLDTRAAAASPMLPSTVMPGGSAYITRFEVQPGFNDLLRPEPTFWDFIKKGSTNAETYIWRNKRPTDGAAGWIGPGEYKPAISFTINKEASYAKKIAVNEKVATELFDDIDGFTTFVTDELYYQLMQKTNDILQGAGAGDSETPEGIQHMSVAYNPLTGVKTTNANFWDAIKAMVTQLRVTRFRGQIVAFVNPVDLANGVMTKAQNQGQLFIPPVTGCMIVEDLNMTLGSALVFATDYYKLLIYKAFRMEWGLENDDLTKNLRTVIGEMRLHQFHSQNYDGFAVYDTLANVIAAIDTAP